MCGVVGWVGGGSTESSVWRRMLDSLSHRGPDDEGVHVDTDVVLGQRRLSIIDLSGGRQPLANENDSLQLVCNGEIYNYRELQDELREKGHVFRTASDCEVILHLYEEHGERCVDRLRGMFAFALWDSKRRTLLLCRDRFGQKPLYYCELGERLVFASEIKALLAYDPGLAELDLEALDQYLALRFIAPPRSMFRSIRKLPPAHSLTFRVGSAPRIERYWNPCFAPKWEGSEEELTEELERRMIDSLRSHMVSDVPVGAFLSGGLDSTLVVAMATEHVVSKPLQTFSMGIPYRDSDEAPYARLVAEKYGTEHREETIVPSLLQTLPKLIWHLDEPSDPLSVCSYLIAEMASKHVKVVLGGDGGDELFGGYDRYYGNRYAGHYAMIPRVLRRAVIGPLLRLLPDGGWYKSRAHQLKWLHRLSLFSGSERYAESLGYFYFHDDLRRELYGPEMVEVLSKFDPRASIREPYDAALAESPLDRMLYADSQVRLPDHSVMILDRMTMAHGLEARSPLLDHELAEFAARLPDHMKVKGRSLRRVQMRLARKYLPEAVVRRPKQGFSSALPYLLGNEYEALYRRFLQRAELATDGILEQRTIDRVVSEQQSGAVDHGNRLWLLLNSEVWYRMFFKGRTPEDLSAELDEIASTLPPTTRPQLVASS